MIYILDDFLDKNFFEFLKNFSKSNQVKYKPQYFEGTLIKNEQNTYGLRHEINLNDKIIFNLKNKCLEKFKYKIVEITECGLDRRKLTNFKPHVDDKVALVNFYLQIEGQTKLNHGIGFYTNENLDIHIGFKENRAVLFNSNICHTPLKEENIWRTTLTCFIKQGYFV